MSALDAALARVSLASDELDEALALYADDSPEVAAADAEYEAAVRELEVTRKRLA